MNEHKIYVIYLGVGNTTDEELISQYVEKIKNKIIPENIVGEVVIIPTFSYETKMECINPRYITDENLIKEHEALMKKLNNNLKEIGKLKKIEKNEENKNSD